MKGSQQGAEIRPPQELDDASVLTRETEETPPEQEDQVLSQKAPVIIPPSALDSHRLNP